eukprot:gene710-1172_t
MRAARIDDVCNLHGNHGYFRPERKCCGLGAAGSVLRAWCWGLGAGGSVLGAKCAVAVVAGRLAVVAGRLPVVAGRLAVVAARLAVVAARLAVVAARLLAVVAGRLAAVVAARLALGHIYLGPWAMGELAMSRGAEQEARHARLGMLTVSMSPDCFTPNMVPTPRIAICGAHCHDEVKMICGVPPGTVRDEVQMICAAPPGTVRDRSLPHIPSYSREGTLWSAKKTSRA